MRTRPLAFVVISVMTLSMLAGCSGASFYAEDFFGISIRTLEKVKDSGMSKVYPLTSDEAFDKMIKVVKDYNLILDKTDKKRGYLIVMGFPKQVDTTPVGVFFDKVDDKSTKITLSCLSSTCLSKAGYILFAGMDGIPPQLNASGASSDSTKAGTREILMQDADRQRDKALRE